MRFRGSRHPAYRKPLVGEMMPFGTYFSPSTTTAEMNVVSSLVDALDLDVEKSDTVDERFKSEWEAFRDEWRRFLDDNSGIIARSLNQTFALTLEYRDRANEWRKRFIAEGGITATAALPDSALKRAKAGIPWGSIMLVAGIAGLGYFLLKKA